MSAVEWLKDGRSFITTTQSSQIINWTIHNVDGKTKVTAAPTLFDNKGIVVVVVNTVLLFKTKHNYNE